MKDFLFRAKRLDNNEWISAGSVIRLYNNGTMNYYMPNFNEKCSCIHDTWTGDILKFTDCRFYKVNTDTISMSTGVKDKFGNDIFENDIIVCTQYIGGEQKKYYSMVGYVEMKCGAFGLNRKNEYYRPFKDWLEDCSFEVIGNIFDNPELLDE